METPDQTQNGEQTQEQSIEQQQPQIDPAEEKARQAGWRPQEEFDGDPDTWVDAKEFLKRQPLYDTIKGLKRKTKEQERTIQETWAHMEKVHKVAYEKALSDLKAQRREAVEMGNADQVDAIDEEMDKVKEAAKQGPKQQNGPDPAITEFISKNPWTSDPEMWTFAVSYDAQLMQTQPQLDIEERLEKVKQTVKRAYPDKFQEPAKSPTVATVESGKSVPRGKKSFGVSDLSPEQRKVHDRYVRQGISSEAYIKELVAIGELK